MQRRVFEGRVNNAHATPFAASPYGRLPLWLMRFFGQHRQPISYVSLVPRDTAHVDLEVYGKEINQNGLAYHEQGRFDGTPREFQREGWTWFHIFGSEWNIFGAENAYIYITNGKDAIGHGYPMWHETFTLLKKEYRSHDPRVLQAAMLEFKTGKISLIAMFESSYEDDLIHLSSTDRSQLWSMRYSIAKVSIEYEGKTHKFSAPALLETCVCKIH